MRVQRLLVIASLVLVGAAACDGDDDSGSDSTVGEEEATTTVVAEPSAPAETTTPDETTAPTDTTPAPADTTPSAPSSTDSEWVSAVIEIGGATGQRPMLLVDEAGRIAVVFQRQTAPGAEYDLVLDYCDDATCSDASNVTLRSGRFFPDSAGATSDGPLAVGLLADEEWRASMVVWSCADPECRSTVETIIGNHPVNLYATPGELPLIAYADWSENDPSAFEVVIGFCADTACSAHTPVRVHQGLGGFGGDDGSLHKLADGSPVLFFPGVEGMDTVWDVIVCGDPECSDVVVHHQDGTWADVGAPAPAGVPSEVYAAGKQIRQLACVDQACSTITDTLIHSMAEAEVLLLVSADYVGDQLVLLTQAVNDWPEEPKPEESGHMRFLLALFTCDDTGCSATLEPPVSEGNMTAMTATGENGIAVVVQTGRGDLCNVEGEYCVDPNQPLSQLTLYTTELNAE